LFASPQEKALLEARNGLKQFDEVLKLIAQSGGVLALTPDIVKNLQRIAIQDIYVCAGSYRTWPIHINGTSHQPPEHDQVEQLVEQMCDYANASINRPPIHTAAYLLWRLNWIHPFGGGNGRTSRAISYLALCARLGFALPGKLSMPEQIVANRQPYYDALDLADAAWKAHQAVDVGNMEKLLEAMLARQLFDVYQTASDSAGP